MKKDKNLDELFRDKLLNYEQEPPAYLLESILDASSGARRKRRIIYWRVAGIAAAVLLAFVAGWQLSVRNIQDMTQPVVVSNQQSEEVGVKPEQTAVAPNQSSEISLAQLARNEGLKESGKSDEMTPVKSVASTTLVAESGKRFSGENDSFSILKPMKRLSKLLERIDHSGNNLQEGKLLAQVSREDWTIDQQIMEQNKQTMAAMSTEKNKGRWLIGAQVSPGYSVERSKHTQVYASNMVNASAESPVEVGGGVSVEYKPGKRWSVQSGIYYSGVEQSSGNSSYLSNHEFLTADRGAEYFNAPVNIASSRMMMNTTAGVIEFKNIPEGLVLGTAIEEKAMYSAVVVSDAEFIQNFDYIEIPLYLRYTLLDSKFGIEMLGGFSSNVLVGNETFMDSQYGKNLIGKTQDMQTLNYSGTLGVGFKYSLSRRLYLNLEPRVKYYLNSLNTNSEVTYKPYTIGVFTGLSYEF